MLTRLREKLPPSIGVTAKIRLPPTQADADAGRLGNLSEIGRPQTIEERIQGLVDCGVDLITVHGRTRLVALFALLPISIVLYRRVMFV